MSDRYDYRCIGLISGSSLDGVDIALVQMQINPGKRNPIGSWKLEKANTFEFPEELRTSLQNLPKSTALELVEMDDRLGSFMGHSILELADAANIDFVSSHGHTVFHHPGKSSTQIGNPAIIAAITGVNTISHLRNMDTAYGGHGAPLAPMADLYLFSEHDVCINLGGIANISVKSENGIVGFDVCGANQFLNYLAQRVGKIYDAGGEIARSGKVDLSLLEQLNAIPYCLLPHPKSLDNEGVRAMYLPILKKSLATVSDQMCTMVEHIAQQLGESISSEANSAMIAGGGAHNLFLIERIENYSACKLVVPQKEIVDFKEAILIAMCGALRLHELPNSIKSITGASKDTVNGVVFLA